MMEGWKEVKLKEICEFRYGKNLPEKARVLGDYPVYGSSGIVSYHKDYLLKGPGIIVGRKGTVGKVQYSKSSFYPIDTTFYVKEDTSKVDLKFLYYRLPLSGLDTMNSDAAVPGLNRTAAINQKINLPPLPTQRKIAKILSAYDDLIENNLKRIKLLEEMAQITYEEWFVRMKFPGHETAVFDEETGLPEGWKNKKLKTFLSIKHGYAYKGEFFTEMETNRILLTPGNFKIGGGIQLKKIKYYSDVAECPKDYILKRNDLLLTMTDLSKMGDTLGYPLLIPSSNKLFLHNQRLGKVQLIKGDFFPKYFLYFLFKEDGYRAFVVGSSSGATVKHTSPNKILSFKAKFPDLSSDIVKEFERKIKPTFESIDKLQQQNQLLKEARDILLPRLMTGMISV